MAPTAGEKRKRGTADANSGTAKKAKIQVDGDETRTTAPQGTKRKAVGLDPDFMPRRSKRQAEMKGEDGAETPTAQELETEHTGLGPDDDAVSDAAADREDEHRTDSEYDASENKTADAGEQQSEGERSEEEVSEPDKKETANGNEQQSEIQDSEGEQSKAIENETAEASEQQSEGEIFEEDDFVDMADQDDFWGFTEGNEIRRGPKHHLGFEFDYDSDDKPLYVTDENGEEHLLPGHIMYRPLTLEIATAVGEVEHDSSVEDFDSDYSFPFSLPYSLPTESDFAPSVDGPMDTFHPFTRLPHELKLAIYTHALTVDHAIKPHLCGTDPRSKEKEPLKFHDDNVVENRRHGFPKNFFALTFTCKDVRKYALPIFYSENTFECGPDTPIYFAYLEHLDRLKHIHHVDLTIPLYRGAPLRRDDANDASNRLENHTTTAADNEDSRSTADKDDDESSSESDQEQQQQQTYYKSLAAKRALRDILDTFTTASTTDIDFASADFHALKQHPLFVSAGCPEVALFLTMRILSSTPAETTTSKGKTKAEDNTSDAHNTRAITLTTPVAPAHIAGLQTLDWFRTLCHSLSLSPTFIAGPSVDNPSAFSIEATWHQSSQRKRDGVDDADARGDCADLIDLEDVEDKMEGVYGEDDGDSEDGDDEGDESRCTCFYRVNCWSKAIEWYDILH